MTPLTTHTQRSPRPHSGAAPVPAVGTTRRSPRAQHERRAHHRTLLLVTIALLLLTMVISTFALALVSWGGAGAPTDATALASSSKGPSEGSTGAPGSDDTRQPLGDASDPPGLPGADGVDGRDGTNGVNGLDGQDGIDGSKGATGARGAAGKDGRPGPAGPAGPAGPTGAPGQPGSTTGNGSANLGTGVATIGTCDSAVGISLGSSYAFSTDTFTLSSITLSDIDAACNGRALTLMLYNSAGTLLAQTSRPITLTSGGNATFSTTVPASSLSATVDATAVSRLVFQVT